MTARFRELTAALVVTASLLSSFVPGTAMAAGPATESARPDYFMSPGTVIIGCTAGAASGALAAGVPISVAIATGVAVVPAAWAFMTTITILGCLIGAATGGVAVGTAWLLDRYDIQ